MTDTEFTLINTRFDSVEKLLNGVNSRLDGINGKVNKHESQISEALGERVVNRKTQDEKFAKVEELEVRVNLVEKAELIHYTNCPLSKDVRTLLDDNLSNKSVKKFMGAMFLGGVALGSMVVGLLKLILG